MEPLNLEEIKYSKISQDNEINSLDSQSAKSNENFFSMKNSLPPPPTPFDLNQECLMNNEEKEIISPIVFFFKDSKNFLLTFILNL